MRALLRFLALGGLLFAVVRFLGPPGPLLVPSPLEVAALERDWQLRTGRRPDPDERRRLREVALDDEMIYREALVRGFAERDGLVAQRLARNMRFVEPAGSTRARDELRDDALALGMHETDLVVRRRLIQKLVLEIEGRARVEPSERELESYLERERDRFRSAARVRISQVFFSARSGEGAAERALEALRNHSAGSPPAGDAFPVPRDLPSRSEAQLAATFGPAFASAVFELAPGGWTPLGSSFGVHLVRVLERIEERDGDLFEVRGAVRDALLSERAEAAVAREIASLRRQHQVAR
jgi:hypothetical protein